MIGDLNMTWGSRRKDKKKGDPDTMLESRRNDRGSGHDVGEPLMDLESKQLKGRRGMPQYGI